MARNRGKGKGKGKGGSKYQQKTQAPEQRISDKHVQRIQGSAQSAVRRVSGMSRTRTQSDQMAQTLGLPPSKVWPIFKRAFQEAGGRL